MHRELPELLFLVFELHNLILQFKEVVQRYYLEYLTGHDAGALRDMLQA